MTGNASTFVFEIFVQSGYSDLEFSSITNTLITANQITNRNLFDWQIVTDTPSLVKGLGGTIVRAAPAIPDHDLCDCMIVVGANNKTPEMWLRRLRSMQRKRAPVILLSNAATAYIKSLKSKDRLVTTHWKDIEALREIGYYPELTSHLFELSDGVITSAGFTSTIDVLISIIADFLAPHEVAELSNHMMVSRVRDRATEQPTRVSARSSILDSKIRQTIRLMEKNVEEPLAIGELAAQVGISARQLERKFKCTLMISPVRFYKQLRLKHARILLQQTEIDIANVAFSTGFNSAGALSRSFQSEYGETPTIMRNRMRKTLF